MSKRVIGFTAQPDEPERNERDGKSGDKDKTQQVLDRYFSVRPPVDQPGSESTTMSSAEICIALEDVWPRMTVEEVTVYMTGHGYRTVQGEDGRPVWLMRDPWEDNL